MSITTQSLVQYDIVREHADTILLREAQRCLHRELTRLDSCLGETWGYDPTEEINLYQAANNAFHSITAFIHACVASSIKYHIGQHI